jgi:hypothetical protein
VRQQDGFIRLRQPMSVDETFLPSIIYLER